MRDATSAARPIVVCLHGSAGNSDMWHDFERSARGRCVVVTPELFPGGTREDATRDDVVDYVLRQLESVEQAFHIVGHAYGGAVATWIAARCPQRVLSLVLYEPADVAGMLEDVVDVPVRLISGTRSWQAARRAIGRIVAQYSNVSSLQLFGMRHMAPLTHPHLVNPVLLDFILPLEMPGVGGTS